MHLVDEIEELAFHAWPAAEVRELDGWRLRFTQGVTRRANSVWPNRLAGLLTLDQRLNAAETFYTAHDQPICYQICAAARPSELDAVLQSRGYRNEAKTAVQVARIAIARARAAPPSGTTVEISEAINDRWLTAYYDAEPVSSGEAAVRRAILGRISRPTAFVLLSVAGEPAAVGLGVGDGDWVGVFCMATRPAFRRRGAATGVLHALATWGEQRGATDMYLQVMHENTPALRLYDNLGFHTVYDYHFRIASPSTSPR